MAVSLAKLGKIIHPLASRRVGLFYNVVRPKVYTNDDWKPGPYPKTPEERKKAAEKYGLEPEEYEPYPDDGCGLGDYPKLPMIGTTARDPYYPWDDPVYRRNLDEPMHKHFNIMGEDRGDFGVKEDITRTKAYSMLLGVVGTMAFIAWIMQSYPMYHPVTEKQIPKPGVIHYTFEPAR